MRSARVIGGFFAALIAGILGWVLVLLLLTGLPLSILQTPERIPQSTVTVYMVGLYLGLMALVALFWRKVIRLPWADLGLKPSGYQLMRGLLVGFGGLAVLMGIELAAGWAHFVAPQSVPPTILLGTLGAAVAFAVSEEIVFRGFFLRTLARDHSPRHAIVLSALLFSTLHFVRGNLTWLDLFPFVGLFAAGVVLALGTLRTGSIWLAVGIHTSWIWFISLSGQLGLWQWAEHALLYTGGAGISGGLIGIALFVPMAFVVSRRHA